MAENSKIEWTHHTINTHWGCVKVHRGCDNCYAEYFSDVRKKNGLPDTKLWGPGTSRKVVKSAFPNLARFQAKAESEGAVRRVFIGSMMDIFEKPMPLIDHHGNDLPGTTDDLRQELFQNITDNCYPNLMFLFLTKRPSNINKYIPSQWIDLPPRNVMFGASVIDQASSENVAAHLKHVNGHAFLSMEPLLDRVDMSPFLENGSCAVDWIIVGGESGHNRRPFNPSWAREIRDFCQDTGTPFFMKQWDKVKAIPDDLLIRQFPACHDYLQVA